MGLTQSSYSCAKGTRGGFEPQSCDRKTQPGGRKTQLGLNKLDWVVRIIELRSRKTRLGGPKIWRASRKNSIGTAKTRLGGAENGLACPENSIGWPGKVSGARRKRTSVMREPGFQKTGFAERPKMRGGGLSLASDNPPLSIFAAQRWGFQATARCICGSETHLGLTQMSYSCANGTRGGLETRRCDRKNSFGWSTNSFGTGRNSIGWSGKVSGAR